VSYAQFGMSHEIGVLAGPAAFFTDYGERWNVRNNLENGGFGIGLIHYMNFVYSTECDCYNIEGFFNDHFRIRNEIDYLQTKLDHFGPVASKDSDGGERLRAMHGFTEVIEIGTHLEYYPMGIRDFTNFGYMLSPYISLGVHYVRYNPDAYSDLGDLDNPKVYFPAFENGINLEAGNTFSVVGSLGVRYRLGMTSDLLLESRWMYYDSDWLDGLNVQGKQNMFNDFAFWFSLGYVYYLGF